MSGRIFGEPRDYAAEAERENGSGSHALHIEDLAFMGLVSQFKNPFGDVVIAEQIENAEEIPHA